MTPPRYATKNPIVRAGKTVVHRVVRTSALDFELPAAYRKAAKQPVDKRKVLFVSEKLYTAPDAYNVIMPYIQRNYDLDVTFISLAHGPHSRLLYNRMCLDFVRELATAAYVFLDDASGIVSCVPLRPETKVVQLWHACGAFKKWGFSTAEKIFGDSARGLRRHPNYANLSLVTTSAAEVNWAYEEAMGLTDQPGTVQAVGVSRTDRFFDPAFLDEAFRDLYAEIPQAVGKRVLLYAPTFRGRVAMAEAPDALDIRALCGKLSDKWILLVKHHPFVKNLPAIPKECEGFAFDVSKTMAIDKLLVASDALITDYSSVVFEYSLSNRPMCFFAYDLGDYDDWRGFFYPYEEMTPGPIFDKTEEIAEWAAALPPEAASPEAAAFRNRFMSACDGHATERICEIVIDKPEGPLAKPAPWDRLTKEPDGNERTADSSSDPDIDISVIIPAYNVESCLERALESVSSQPYPHDRMEIIVADDCSTDNTRAIAERFAAEHPGLVRLISTERNSGTPAAPRNMALDIARGRYVFFLDADDWIGEGALPAMMNYAIDWDSDILLARMVGEDGRKVPRSMFARNEPRVDVWKSKVTWTLGPTKLFRRQLIEESAIRFPEGVMPEDIAFTLQAYAAANTVSVAADLDYYHCSWDGGDDAHLSIGTWDTLEPNFRAFEEIFRIVDEKTPEEARDYSLMRRLFRRDGYNMLQTAEQLPEPDRARAQERLRELFGPYWRPSMQKGMPEDMKRAFEKLFARITRQGKDRPAQAPKVSVLTPIYNVERFLPQCLESLKAQTLEDIEFICINDGSTDGSREILENLTAGDPRFVIVDKPNSGYGASMNVGLSAARGEYIGILESDDFADPDCFKALYDLAVENGTPDIVKANHYRLWGDGTEDLCENYPESLCNRRLAPFDPEYGKLIASIPAIWAAIYHRDFLETSGIDFLETPGASFQDTGFVMKSWIAADSVYVDHAARLHYRCINEGSSSASKGKHLCVMDEYASIGEFLAKQPAGHEHLAPAVQAKRLDTYWWNLKRIHPSLRQEFARKAQTELLAIDRLGVWEQAPLSDAERKRLATWMQDPDRLLLDLAISEARKRGSLTQYLLRLKRKMSHTR